MKYFIIIVIFFCGENAFSQQVTMEHFITKRIGDSGFDLSSEQTAQATDSELSLVSVCQPIGLRVQHQPFFCRVELNIERKSKLSPRFRLGSLDYVNYLEGKYLQNHNVNKAEAASFAKLRRPMKAKGNPSVQ